jgi:hypothetical protein
MCSRFADDIIITAVVVRKWKPPVADMRCEVALALLANHVQVLNERKCTVNVSPEEAQNFEVSVQLLKVCSNSMARSSDAVSGQDDLQLMYTWM